MDDVNNLVLLERIRKLERRIEKLETERRIQDAGGEPERLLESFPFMMTKTDVSRALGVTRYTVYNMIKDGRLEVNPVGRIPTRSVIDCIKKGLVAQ